MILSSPRLLDPKADWRCIHGFAITEPCRACERVHQAWLKTKKRRRRFVRLLP